MWSKLLVDQELVYPEDENSGNENVKDACVGILGVIDRSRTKLSIIMWRLLLWCG